MGTAAVREARAEDAADIAAVQVEVWRTAYVSFLPPEVLEQLDVDEVRAAWERAITTPGEAQVLVATESGAVTGFAAGTGMEIATVLVAPRWTRRGHGGRLLGTLGEGLAAAGAERGVVWVAEGDEAGRSFFSAHGWLADGTVRTSHLTAGGAGVLRELRHTGPLRADWL